MESEKEVNIMDDFTGKWHVRENLSGTGEMLEICRRNAGEMPEKSLTRKWEFVKWHPFREEEEEEDEEDDAMLISHAWCMMTNPLRIIMILMNGIMSCHHVSLPDIARLMRKKKYSIIIMFDFPPKFGTVSITSSQNLDAGQTK